MFLKDILTHDPDLTVIFPHRDGSFFLAHQQPNLDLVRFIQDLHAPALTDPTTVMRLEATLSNILLANAPPTQVEGRLLLPPPDPSPLAPWLSRHPPLYLMVATTLLKHVYRLSKAVSLTHSLCPSLLPLLDLDTQDWYAILLELLRQLEDDDFFRVDWPRLEYRQTAELYLDFMPVRCFALHDALLEQFPFLMLFLALLRPEFNLLAADFEAYGLALDPDYLDKSALAELVPTLDFSPLPPPLCWLGAVFQLVLGDTGNLILDTVIDPHDPDLAHFAWPWHSHLHRLKSEWQAAKKSVEHLDCFFDWCAYDYDYSWLTLAVQFILGAGGYDVL